MITPIRQLYALGRGGISMSLASSYSPKDHRESFAN